MRSLHVGQWKGQKYALPACGPVERAKGWGGKELMASTGTFSKMEPGMLIITYTVYLTVAKGPVPLVKVEAVNKSSMHAACKTLDWPVHVGLGTGRL